MRNLILAILLLASFSQAQGVGGKAGLGGTAGFGGGATASAPTITLANSVQFTNTACTVGSGAQCTLTVTATTSGNAIVILSENGTGSSNAQIVSASGCGTWVHPANTYQNGGGNGGLDLIYTLSATASCTSITLTYTTGLTVSKITEAEFHSTGSSWSLDASNSGTYTASASPSGLALGTGTTDAIVQGIVNSIPNCSAINGTYTNPAYFTGGYGAAGAINLAGGTAPTWTCSNNAGVKNGIALVANP